MVRQFRGLAVSLLLTVLLWVLGCGGSDLTGGSVPIGNPSPTRLVGTVVDEEDPSTPLADAEVEIVLEDGTKFKAKTDTSGMFVVELPRGKQCTLRVRPPSGFEALYQERVDSFSTDADEIRLLLPIPRKGTVMPSLVELRIYPEEVTLRVGERVQFQISLVPRPSSPVTPVWSLHGSIGVITPDGLFIATRPGRGIVRVRIGNLHAAAVVTVRPE